MKYTFNKTLIGIVLLGLFGFTACQEDEHTTLDVGFMAGHAIQRNLSVGNDSTQVMLWINTDANYTWTATTTYNWLNIEPATGTGESTVFVRVNQNPDGENRTGAIAVSVGSTSRTVYLTQREISSGGGDPSVIGNPDRYVPFRLELPLVRDSMWFISHSVDGVVNFALEYDTAQRHAVWVAYQLTREHLTGRIDRDFFTFDPRIPIRLQPHEVIGGELRIPRYWSTYGFERGHIMASADRTNCQIANDQSNFMSNISPHLPEFHNTHGGTGSGQGVWLRLEHLVRDWARMQGVDTLYVVKGGSIIPGAPGTEIAQVLYRLNRTVVPRWHFKAVVQRRGDTFDGIAFWLEQYRGMARRPVTRADAMTIRQLEALTGIDFFPNLSILGAELGRPGLEESVETTPINWARWPGIN